MTDMPRLAGIELQPIMEEGMSSGTMPSPVRPCLIPSAPAPTGVLMLQKTVLQCGTHAIVPNGIAAYPLMNAQGPRLRALRQHQIMRWLHSPFVQTAAFNLMLILTWWVSRHDVLLLGNAWPTLADRSRIPSLADCAPLACPQVFLQHVPQPVEQAACGEGAWCAGSWSVSRCGPHGRCRL